jgi:hypothetical protein
MPLNDEIFNTQRVRSNVVDDVTDGESAGTHGCGTTVGENVRDVVCGDGDTGNTVLADDIFNTLDADADACGCLAKRKIYYDISKKEYLTPNREGIWMPHTENQIRRLLKREKFSPFVPKDSGSYLSPLEVELMRIADENSVAYAGPIAGMKAGICEENNRRILVTESPNLIIEKAGDWSSARA